MRLVPSLRSLLFALVMLVMSTAAFAQVGVAITIGPPPIPIYDQPLCPGDGYLWTPGYWAYDYDVDDYYWVPGTWILAPEVGFLWTPGWWGWGGEAFIFHEGFWGPTVGFYGGINYGFGYFGTGFFGGEWRGGAFFYNTAVLHVDTTRITNVYVNRTVIVNNNSHVAYNGGPGGVTARPTPREEAAEHERHIPPVAAQTQHLQSARTNPELRASANHGKPPIAATQKPGDFRGNVAPAREAGGKYEPPPAHGGNAAHAESNAARPGASGHVRDLPPAERPPAPNTGNPKLDKKYQKEQEKLYANQQKERQKVAQQQEKEDREVAKQNNEPAKQQVEQRHQQQTQQLQEKHVQQVQHMQARQQPRR